jgi:hypothetical protein
MTKDEILSMAREAGLAVNPPSWGYTEHYHFAGFEQTMERFAALVAEKEREACAKLVEAGAEGEDPYCCVVVAHHTAAEIRARGNK